MVLCLLYSENIRECLHWKRRMGAEIFYKQLLWTGIWIISFFLSKLDSILLLVLDFFIICFFLFCVKHLRYQNFNCCIWLTINTILISLMNENVQLEDFIKYIMLSFYLCYLINNKIRWLNILSKFILFDNDICLN